MTLKGLSNRLKIKTPMVRKIAVMDLIKRQDEFGVAKVAQVLLKHLPAESNPQLQVRIIEFLGQSRITEAIEPLEALTSDNPPVADAVRRAVEALRNQQ